MGYDMRWQNDTDHDKAHFHLNGYGMSAYALAMYELGMVYEAAHVGEFPKPGDHGTTWEHVETVEHGYGEVTPAEADIARKYIAARDEYLSQRPDENGIPAFKFSTNDGWWVTADECRTALAIYRGVDQGEREAVLASVRQPWNPGYWDEWVAFMDGAVDHDGFRVH